MSTATHILWAGYPVVVDERDPRPRALDRIWEEEVYPIGNGRLGGTLFGEPQRERLQFNVDSAWVGNEDNTGAYQPFGDVYVDMADGPYRAYRRELDIERAVHSVTYVSDGVTYKREAFASRPADVIVVRFTVDRPAALAGRVSMGTIQNLTIANEKRDLVMRGDTGSFWYWQFLLDNPDRLLASREYASDKNIDLDVEARVRVLNEGGTLRVAGDAIAFEGCDSITLVLAADTNYVGDRSRGWRGEHPAARISERVNSVADRSYDDLLAEHVADYRKLFDRLTLDLGTTTEPITVLPTAERVKRYAAQGEKPADRELEVLLYQYARYLMIASSAPSERALPTNLQGIWCIAKQPPWRCDFHTDINIQMNYWFTQASNLADCFLPFAYWVDSIRDVRKEETRRVLGVTRGWLMRSENGIFGGSTWHIQKGDSAWLCQNLWDHFAFTQDREFLRFEVNLPATLYLAYDGRTTPPAALHDGARTTDEGMHG